MSQPATTTTATAMKTATATGEADRPAQPNDLLKLRAALDRSFGEVARCVSEDEFVELCSYLTYVGSAAAAKRVHKVMEQQLAKSLDNFLQDIVSDACLESGLRELDRLKEESTAPSDAKLWRPPGDVNLHLRSLDAQKIMKECQELERYIQEKDKANEELKAIITAKRKNIQSLNDNVKRLLHNQFKFSELENTVRFNKEYLEKLYD